MEKKGLGRGLEALIPMNATVIAPDIQPKADNSEIDIAKISLNPYQPRKSFDEEKSRELLESVRLHGVLQPILVRIKDNGNYELVAGERRLRAARKAGLKTIPAVVRELSERQSLEMAIVENAQREDINIIDSARAYKQLADEFGMSQDMIASQIGKSRPAIANTMRLLQLPDEVLESLSSGALTEGQARPLLRIEDKQKQLALAKHIVNFKLTSRESERLVKAALEVSSEKNVSVKKEDPNIEYIASELSKIYGTRVSISKGKSKGKIEIEFYNDDDMERILQIMEMSK